MKNWNDSLIALTGRLSESLGPVNTLIDTMTDRLLGKQIAQACTGYACAPECLPYLCSSTKQVRRQLYVPYVNTPCTFANANCTVSTCNC